MQFCIASGGKNAFISSHTRCHCRRRTVANFAGIDGRKYFNALPESFGAPESGKKCLKKPLIFAPMCSTSTSGCIWYIECTDFGNISDLELLDFAERHPMRSICKFRFDLCPPILAKLAAVRRLGNSGVPTRRCGRFAVLTLTLLGFLRSDGGLGSNLSLNHHRVKHAIVE